MSYQATKFVLKCEGLSRSERAVAHCLAYHADADGANAFPSMDTITREAGFRYRQSAQKVVRRLEQKGLIEAVTAKTGGKGVTTVYRFNLEYRIQADALSNPQTASVGLPNCIRMDSEKGDTASVRLPNCIRADARKVLKGIKEKSKREKRAQTFLSNSKQSGQGKTCPEGERRELANEYFIWLIRTFDLILTAKQKAAIEKAIVSVSCDSKLLKDATARNLNGLNPQNSFDRAGEKLAVNLPLVIEANRREAEQQRTDAENLERLKERIQHEAAQERLVEAERDPELSEALKQLESDLGIAATA